MSGAGAEESEDARSGRKRARRRKKRIEEGKREQADRRAVRGGVMIAIGCGILAAGIFVLDLWLKNRAEETLEEGEEKPICQGRLLLRKYHNKGAFLDIGEKRQGAVAALSVVLSLFLTVCFLAAICFRKKASLRAGLSLLLGGAYSNTYDRLARKHVVDYVSFPVKNEKIRQIVFNLSDFCIMAGALTIVLSEAASGE